MVQDATEVYAIKERCEKEDKILKEFHDEINGRTYLKYIYHSKEIIIVLTNDEISSDIGCSQSLSIEQPV